MEKFPVLEQAEGKLYKLCLKNDLKELINVISSDLSLGSEMSDLQRSPYIKFVCSSMIQLSMFIILKADYFQMWVLYQCDLQEKH